MKKIFVRSPYFIEIDEVDQTSGRIELFLWNQGNAIPSVPIYTLEKQIPSFLQTKLSWNISNFAKEFIKPVNPISVNVPTEENSNVWCYMRVVSYSDDVEINDETFICLNGYTQFLDGYNYSTTNDIVPLVNVDIKLLRSTNVPYINVFLASNDYNWSGDIDNFFSATTDGMWKLPVDFNTYQFGVDGSPTDFDYFSEQLCEPKYTPIVCAYVNRFGGWQFLTFFKANQQSIEVKSNTYNLMPQSINYNTFIGANKNFNFNGTQKITCNTGWVNENYFDLIQDLMLSETILLDNVPVICKSTSTDFKTHLKDKNINYTINFEYNFNLINDVI